jgi:opacity protein-like surface antigen
MMRPLMPHVLAAVAVLLALVPGAAAQTLEPRGFADIGVTAFAASKSFEAVLGSSTGVVFGGGGGIVLPQNIFVDFRASRFQKTGSRVVVSDGEVFDLGIENTITITPVEITAGYQFGRARGNTRPYVGAGVGWYRYKESDRFATSGEAASETFTGFQVLGGAEFRVHRYVGLAGEVAWARVPDALGQEPGSAGTAFGETDLGGTTFRVKVVIGR